MQDFITLKRSRHALAWKPEIVGRRVISWLSNSVLVLDTGEPEAYETFLRALTSQLRYLSASYRDAPDGVPRLVALMALIYAGLCIAEQQAVVDRYSRPFCKELDRQILPDGGHISRNPDALVELLLDLLPLRQCFVARDRAPPKELTDAIDRIMPMLRFFRTGDGTLARFNGAGPTPTDALATVLAYDDVEGSAGPRGGELGLCAARLRADHVDLRYRSRAAPSVSTGAHAGFLSFEMSSANVPDDRQLRIALRPITTTWRPFARSTAAHSTLDLRGFVVGGIRLVGRQWQRGGGRRASDRPGATRKPHSPIRATISGSKAPTTATSPISASAMRAKSSSRRTGSSSRARTSSRRRPGSRAPRAI